MLQQTQVDRVIPRYVQFLERFPNIETLAAAPRADVVRAWRGLGYNARAVRLAEFGREVQERFVRIPQETEALRSLPGVGPYTAAAIRVFAFELDDVAMDTNLRRVTHRLKFGIEYPPLASARTIDETARALLPRGNAHDFNSALMDLGATICTARAPKCLVCPLRDACAAAPISASVLDARKRRMRVAPPARFRSTTRFARGRIVDRLRALPPGAGISLLDLQRALDADVDAALLERVPALLSDLEADGIVQRRGEAYALSE
ncbi:MAG: A/G-specific adenine glycosylase [Candidatus Eremiobacteraeota bacterium]|nr:A/G-specific adenine glycosylase [Candidatus Eremiobacteraeota bacterium]